MADKRVIHLLITIAHSGGWVSPEAVADTIRENIDESIAAELDYLEIPYELVQVQMVEQVAPLRDDDGRGAHVDRALVMFKVVKL